MRSNLRKKILTVRDKSGTHRQTYYVADKPTLELAKGHTVQTTAPRDRASIHYGMLWSRDANKGIDHALEAIGKTHKVPADLYKIPIKVKGSMNGSNGTYEVYNRQGTNQINVSKYAMGPAAVVAHEYGHFLDHHLFGTGKQRMNSMGTSKWSEHGGNPEMNGIMGALYSSKAARELVKKHKEHSADRDYMGKQRTEYLLMPAEMFARGYAQWIGTRSSPQIRKEIQEYHEHWMTGGYHAQWSDEDFAPIAREFDRLFAKRRLRRST